MDHYLINQTKETFIIQFPTSPKKKKVQKSFNSPCVLVFNQSVIARKVGHDDDE